jgi:glycosyltransferase involved in cell wall biosynthesis
LESVKDFDEIIVCDGNSTDETLEIAKEYECKIIPQYKSKRKNIKAKNKSYLRNKTLKIAKNDWYFWIDSDDYASKELVSNVRKVVAKESPTHFLWSTNFIYRIENKLIKHSANYPFLRIVLFHKKSMARFYKPSHERIRFDRRFSVGNLKGSVYVCWPKERTGKLYWRNARVQMDKSIKLVKDKSWAHYWKWSVWFNIKNMARYILKPIRNYLFYGFEQSMPPRVEYYRMAYHSILLWRVTKYKIMVGIRKLFLTGSR